MFGPAILQSKTASIRPCPQMFTSLPPAHGSTWGESFPPPWPDVLAAPLWHHTLGPFLRPSHHPGWGCLTLVSLQSRHLLWEMNTASRKHPCPLLSPGPAPLPGSLGQKEKKEVSSDSPSSHSGNCPMSPVHSERLRSAFCSQSSLYPISNRIQLVTRFTLSNQQQSTNVSSGGRKEENEIKSLWLWPSASTGGSIPNSGSQFPET